jgi:uncharacterized membrane protein YkoI
VITPASAIKIAKKAIAGKVERQEGSQIEVILHTDRYTIIFEYLNPPGVRGPDYDAKVMINAKTGEVLEILGGT